MELGRRNSVDPLVSYSFRVDMDAVDANGNSLGQPVDVARFSGVDGLSYEVEMIEYRDSENPNIPRYRMGRKKPLRVTFKHGVLVGYVKDNDLFSWISQCDSGKMTKRDISITIGAYGPNGVDETGGAPKTMKLSGCMPTKWSLGSLDGNSSTGLIETLEVVAESISR